MKIFGCGYGVVSGLFFGIWWFVGCGGNDGCFG